LLIAAAAIGARWAQAPWKAFARLRDGVTAHYQEEVRMFLALNKLVPHAALVVTELDNVVLGEYANSKAWLGIDLGTTRLTYDVPVKFFYAVSLAGEEPFTFTFEDARTLTVTFEAPSLFSLEPDIGKLEQAVAIGWARTAALSGANVKARFKERVMADLHARGEALAQQDLVREPARKRLVELVGVFLQQVHPAEAAAVKTIRVRFRGETGPVAATARPD
jgi:hypothetical protein